MKENGTVMYTRCIYVTLSRYYQKTITEIMMRINIFLLLVLFGIMSCQKYDFDDQLIEEFELMSDFESSTYQISVGLPENYESSSNNYDLIFVLDGSLDFKTTANLCNEISQQENKENVIVVGIMNHSSEGRAFNYTPTEMSGSGGGAGLFLEFITQQLIPELEQKYRLNASRESRAIMGHSFGGLCSTVAFVDFNDFFGNYLLLSASLIWDNQIMFEKEQENRDDIKDRNQIVFQSYGEMESLVIHFPNEAFADRINEHYPNTSHEKVVIQGESHVSSKNKSIEKALAFYFKNK